MRTALCSEAQHECHHWLNDVDLCSLGVVTRCSRRERSAPGSIVGHVSVRKRNMKFPWRVQLRVEGLTTRLERVTSRTVRRQEFCEPPDKENHVPSSTGTSDSANWSGSLVHVFQRLTVTASAWQVGLGAKFGSFSSRCGLILCGVFLGVLRIRSPAFQIRCHDRFSGCQLQ